MRSPFWRYAREMLHERGLIALALVMAFVSAAGLGAGLGGLVLILGNVFGEEGKTLRDLAREANAGELLAGRLPGGLIDALPNGRFETVVVVVVALGVLTVVGGAANFLHTFWSLTVVTRTVARIRRRAFRRVVRFPLGAVVGARGADLASRIVNDTNQLNKGMQALTSKAVAQVTKGAAAFIAALVINWWLSLIAVVVAPVLAVVIRKLGKRIRRASKGSMRSQARLLGVVGDTLSGFRVVKVYGREAYEVGRFSRDNRDVVREQLRLRTAKAVASPLIEVVTIFALGGLAIIAAKQIIDGTLTKSEFIGVLGALAAAGGSLRPMTGVIQDLQSGEAAATRIDKLMDAGVERDERRAPRLGRHRESIVFEGVSFSYPGREERALRGVDVRIAHGETVAFVGPNGSGKTTLLSLVPRLYDPSEGRVLIDGHDIAGVSLRSLRGQIGVVTQETVLFHGTVAQNIAYGLRGASRERVEEAARRAHAEEFIARLPGGYDAEVGDQGLTLSGGQRQRLAIARAILRDPSILILDEATSMIDTESEALITRALEDFGRERTVLVVAHRLATVVGADRIVVMDGGRVLDTGTHEELMGRCGLYRELAHHALRGGEAEREASAAPNG